MNDRIKQLDSIRGLAALSVLLSHIIIVKTELYTQSMRTPFRLFTNGHAAVILFFVLSGFVLSLPFLDKKNVHYIPYLIKRVFRIYIPYIIAITVAMISAAFFYQHKIENLSSWFNRCWDVLPNLNLIFEHIVLIGNTHTDTFNGVIWSLIHELRISLIFPFMVLLINRLALQYIVLICLLLSSIPVINGILNIQAANSLQPTTYFDTLHYVSLFMIGSLLAKHRYKLISFAKYLTIHLKWIVFIFSLFIYDFSASICSAISNIHFLDPFLLIMEEYGETLGAVGFVILALGSSKVEKALTIKPIAFLGKISYSLYLYHLVVLIACVHILHRLIPLWSIFIISTVLSIGVSALAWYLIEAPCMKMGRNIASLMKPKNNSLLGRKSIESSYDSYTSI